MFTLSEIKWYETFGGQMRLKQMLPAAEACLM